LGDWYKAEPFDESTGFARVGTTSNKPLDYLLDPSGRKYRVAYDIRNLNEETIALDIPSDQLEPLQAELMVKNPNLEILFVDHTVKNTSPDFTNFLTKISSEFPKLWYLNLYALPLDSLPPEIGELSNLKILDLSSSNLKQLPPQIGQLKKLERIILQFNNLTTLPKEIAELKNLEYLDLEGNRFSESQRNKIKALLPDCQIIFESHDRD
jgi:Leucine-rich repeat (LRR) protein